MRALRIFALLVLVAGAALAVRATYLHAKAELASTLIRRAWQQGIESGSPPAPWPWADTQPVARLRVPRLGYDEIVLEGATPRTLAFGPARLFSSARPGEPGNLVLAGHRTSWFKPIQKVQRGDEIELQWVAGRGELRQRTYRVASIDIVYPQDLDFSSPVNDDELTLLTCYPFGPAPTSPQRLLVHAAPTGPSQVVEIAADHIRRVRG